MAREKGFRVVNPAFFEYSDYFKGTNRNPFCTFPHTFGYLCLPLNIRAFIYKLLAKIRYLLLKSNFHQTFLKVVQAEDMQQHVILSDTNFLHNIRKNDLIFPHGYFFRDPQNLVKHRKIILDYFALCYKYHKKVQMVIRQARSSCDVLIGIHIRQGDYRTYADGKFFYEISIYYRLMRHLEDIFAGKQVHFLVCSDESLHESMFGKLSCTFSNGKAVEDMYSLSACDYITGPPSSFSSWASFYGAVPLYIMWDPHKKPSLYDFRHFPVPPN
jgi:hypothetical protein